MMLVIINIILVLICVYILLNTKEEYRESSSYYSLEEEEWITRPGRYKYNIFVWISLVISSLIPIIPIVVLASLVGWMLCYYNNPQDNTGGSIFLSNSRMYKQERVYLKCDWLVKFIKIKI